MSYIDYRDGELCAEEVGLRAIAEHHGTPAYVYSRAAIESAWRAYDSAFGDRDHLVCYALKANSNLAVLNVLARLGAGFDVVSAGELERVVRAGGDPAKVVFAGVGKRADEMARALLLGIHSFNVESEGELQRLHRVAEKLDMRAPVSLRVNPDVDAQTHPYIATGLAQNKFGIDMRSAKAVYRLAAAMPHIELIGLGCHIGSQLTAREPIADAAKLLVAFADELAGEGIALKTLDFGGGLGVRYQDEQPPTAEEYVATILAAVGDRPYTIVIEPGRSIVAGAGVLLTRVEYLKTGAERHFAIVDAAMNDLIRPSLYQAWQDILPVVPNAEAEPVNYDVVGPVCETGDFLGRDRKLALAPGDLLAIASAGAYGFVMSSNYNTRPRAVEIMVDGRQAHVVRARETISDLLAGEVLLPA
jgi:diaminopimelate decarboxylase